MKSLTTKILESCRSHLDEIVAIRRDIHMYPETGFDVHRTADIVVNQLQNLGLEVKQVLGKQEWWLILQSQLPPNVSG